MAALRCAWIKISSRGATVFRHGAVHGNHRGVQPSDVSGMLATSFSHRGIHRAVAKLQPTKTPITDEERRLLEKLGEPDQETRGYLNELYDDFDVGAEKRKEQRQQQRKQETVNSPVKESDRETTPVSSSRPVRIPEIGRMSNMSIVHRSLHTSAVLREQNKDGSGSSEDTCNRSLADEARSSEASDDHELVKPSMREHKEKFTDEAQIIWDQQEKLDAQSSYTDYYPEQLKVDSLKGVVLSRGETGVFDIDELVGILREERLMDVVVIEVPPKIPYADYIVVCSAVSVRQSKAVTQYLKKMFKRKKFSHDTPLKIEGMDSDDWKVLDMGNIVVHIFGQETRERFDIETLWTVGPDMDDLTRGVAQRGDIDILEEHMNFVRSLTPQHAEVKTASTSS